MSEVDLLKAVAEYAVAEGGEKETAFDRARPEVIERYFGNSVNWNKGRLTNLEFITRLAEITRRRFTLENSREPMK